MYSNKLIHESSPYLLQHAHNPVNWYPWGDEALQKAREEDKPILVSIGYAACHWCHVMEKESFEDEATAALMNEYFVNIKIDREERPDLDHIYMDAVQAMTGSGGWPLNVFLTPSGKPFYGGTYFPPIKAYNRSSWKEVLTSVHQAYLERKNEIEAQAENLTAHLANANSFGIDRPGQKDADDIFTKKKLQEITDNILKQADTVWGGFGNAPKFPQTFAIQFLLRQYHFTKDEKALEQALLSLDKMIYGGIYDQLGGGFARYSTDPRWLAPHFEKMLYDNALLIVVMAEAYQLTKKELYSTTISHTIDFIEREMLDEEGGFYSALDADSEGVEGKFYTWSKNEVNELLGEDASLFCEFYDIQETGNWEHTNITWIKVPVEIFAKEKGFDVAEIDKKLSAYRKKIMQQRSLRVRPQTDDKILLGWNALLNTSLSKAFAATGEERYKVLAEKNIQFIEDKFSCGDGSFYHTYKKNQAKIPAFLDDYAYLAQAYIYLQEITGNSDHLHKAKKIVSFAVENFIEEESGFFFYTSKAQEDVIIRKKEVYDGATPSGNSVMAFNLQYLSMIFDENEWRVLSQKMLASLGTAIVRYPTSFGVWALLAQQRVMGTLEIAMAGKDAIDFIPLFLKEYLPNKIFQATQAPQPAFPLLAGKYKEGKTGFFRCKNHVCGEPVFDFTQFLQLCNT